VSAHTESRIRELCAAVAINSEAEVDGVLRELQCALHEHIALAKDSLEDQATTIPLIGMLVQKRFQLAQA
jgi:hypothetical protein